MLYHLHIAVIYSFVDHQKTLSHIRCVLGAARNVIRLPCLNSVIFISKLDGIFYTSDRLKVLFTLLKISP